MRLGRDFSLASLRDEGSRPCSSASARAGAATCRSPASSSTACCARSSSSSTSTWATGSTWATTWSSSAAATSRSTRRARRCGRPPGGAGRPGRRVGAGAQRGRSTSRAIAEAARAPRRRPRGRARVPRGDPGARDEIEEAEDEGIEIRTAAGPHRFVGHGPRRRAGDDRRGVGVRRRRRFNPPSSRAPRRSFDGGHGDPRRRPGRRPVVADAGDGSSVDAHAGASRSIADTLRTSRAGVWAGGDVAFGPAQPDRRHRRRPTGRGLDPRRARRHATRRTAPCSSVRRAPPDLRRLARRRLRRRVRGSRSRRRRRTPRSASPRSRLGYTPRRRPRGGAPLPALLPTTSCSTRALHPVRPAASTSARELHHDRPRRRVGGSAAERRRACLLLERGPLHPLRALREPLPPGALSMVQLDGGLERADRTDRGA